jgi:hypothetical protein
MTARKWVFTDGLPKRYNPDTVRDRIIRTLTQRQGWVTGRELFEAIQPCASENSMRVAIRDLRRSGWDIDSDWRGPGSLGYRLSRLKGAAA